MALSDWDAVAISNGHQSDGIFTSPLGVEVSLYKNWLYLRDDTAWRRGGNLAEPNVMQIDSGQFTYLDVQIEAIRGPQDGIYAVVWSGSRYLPEVLPDYMIACGVYGFADDPDADSAQPVPIDEYVLPEWLGVTPSSVQFLREHARKVLYAYPDLARGRSWNEVVRFNQGDAFMTGAFGRPCPTSEPGHAPIPLLLRALEGQGEENWSPRAHGPRGSGMAFERTDGG